MKNINTKLSILRDEIDHLDQKLLEILSKRAKVVKKIGKLKNNNKIPPLDKTRWLEVIKSNSVKSKSLNLSTKFTNKIFKVIHEHSISLQQIK